MTTETTDLIIRLIDTRNEKLEQIKTEIGASSKTDVVRRLIDDKAEALFADTSDHVETPMSGPASAVSTTDQEPGQAHSSQASAPEPDDTTPPAPADVGETTIVEDGTQDEEPVNLVVDGGVVALSDVPMNSSSAKLDPFTDDQDFSSITQGPDRLKAIRCALNYLRDEMGIKSQSKEELSRVVDTMFGYTSRYRDEKVDQVIERGAVLPDILEDPLLRERVDDVVRQVYQDAEWADYMSRRDAGALPETLEDVLGELYFENYNEEYYLDEQAYEERVEQVLPFIENAMIRRRALYQSACKTKKGKKIRNRREERLQLVAKMYKAMLDVVAQRTYQWDQPIVEDAIARYEKALAKYDDAEIDFEDDPFAAESIEG